MAGNNNKKKKKPQNGGHSGNRLPPTHNPPGDSNPPGKKLSNLPLRKNLTAGSGSDGDTLVKHESMPSIFVDDHPISKDPTDPDNNRTPGDPNHGEDLLEACADRNQCDSQSSQLFTPPATIADLWDSLQYAFTEAGCQIDKYGERIDEAVCEAAKATHAAGEANRARFGMQRLLHSLHARLETDIRHLGDPTSALVNDDELEYVDDPSTSEQGGNTAHAGVTPPPSRCVPDVTGYRTPILRPAQWSNHADSSGFTDVSHQNPPHLDQSHTPFGDSSFESTLGRSIHGLSAERADDETSSVYQHRLAAHHRVTEPDEPSHRGPSHIQPSPQPSAGHHSHHSYDNSGHRDGHGGGSGGRGPLAGPTPGPPSDPGSGPNGGGGGGLRRGQPCNDRNHVPPNRNNNYGDGGAGAPPPPPPGGDPAGNGPEDSSDSEDDEQPNVHFSQHSSRECES
ncbi:hypothetical protein JAAARDRAFT_192859 [Jaapia argillacea MUCL 33604]|uniref:Uncharacterized protein n=1 Tax=Jaapia argillacea MUCL 33604 TaxID=933084 RepID=A0A067PZQ2_9AGAM|nr:hypothetical protein JAAARDRAFT_192859 [Jaapia argillacea MUCL 33604]